MYFALKVLISAAVIAGASELAKRSSLLAAVLVSLPLTSILALSWTYWDTRDSAKVAELSHGILWAILPSLLFFLVLPQLLKAGLGFAWSMLIACATMAGAYAGWLRLAAKFLAKS